MTREIELEPDNSYSQQADHEAQMWEQHKKDLEELNRLRKEWNETSVRVNQFFQRLGASHAKK